MGFDLDNLISSALSGAGSAATIEGQLQGGESHLMYGQAAMQAAQLQATQLRQNASTAAGIAEINAYTQQRNTKLLESRAMAVAAAGGGGATDPSVVTNMARIAGEGAYRTQAALYTGFSQERVMDLQAQTALYGGSLALQNADLANRSSEFAAGASILKDGASLFSKYGGGAPNSGSGDAMP